MALARGTSFTVWVIGAALIALVACSADPSTERVEASAPPSDDEATLVYVSLGDSWPAGAHCDGCQTFPKTHVEALQRSLGQPITFKDLAGEAQPFFESHGGGSASLLEAIRADSGFRDEVATGDIIVIATGGNDGDHLFEAFQRGTCGGEDGTDCIDDVARSWTQEFDAILDEIRELRGDRPTAIRLVSTANAFLDEANSEDEVARGFATFFQALTDALCDAAEANDAVCVDVRPTLNGPDFEQPVNDSTQESMDAVAALLVEAGVEELG